MRLIFLDYLRIFAFICVLIGHKFAAEIEGFIQTPQLHATPKLILEYCSLLFFKGGIGVVIFFIVSGYIITHILYKNSSVEFLIRRIFKVYPLYICAVLMQLVFMINENPNYEINFPHLIIQLLLLGDFFDVPYTLAGVEWTLRIEILFYVFFALIRYMAPNGLNVPWFFPLLFFLVILFALLPTFPNSDYLFNNYVLLYSPFLFVGVAFYLLQAQQIRFSVFLAFIVLVQCLYWYEIADHKLFGMELHFALMGLIIFTLAWKFRDIFSSHVIILHLSKLTYPIYLFHNWLIDHLSVLFNSKLLGLIGLIFLCSIFYYLIEKPGIRLGRFLAEKYTALCNQIKNENLSAKKVEEF